MPDRFPVFLRKQLCFIAITALLTISPTAIGDVAWDIEYLPSDEYESAFGAGLYQIEPTGFGFYGNFQVTLDDREPKYDNLNVSSFGDPVTERYKDIAILNIGITKRLYRNITTYAGVGYAVSNGIAKKYDPSKILAGDGDYYVDDPANDDSGGNLNGGILFSAAGVVLNIGYHSFTGSPYVGIGGRF